MGHIGVLLHRGGAHIHTMSIEVFLESARIPPIVVRCPHGLRRLALALILRTAFSLCLLCIVLGVGRILLGLLLGLLLGSGSILPGSGDAPAQGPRPGVAFPCMSPIPADSGAVASALVARARVSIGLGASARNAPMGRLGHLPARA